MTTQVIEYWTVTKSDSMGGGFTSTQIPLGNFTTEEVARNHARGNGEWGRDANVKHHRIVVHETIEDKESFNLEELRKRALEKLTAEEKEALGIQ